MKRTITRFYRPKSAGRQAAPSAFAQLQRGIALHRQGRFAEAEALYQAILQADPRHFDALHLLGVLALQAGRAADAATAISQALAVNPHHAEARLNFGVALQESQRLPEALDSFDHVLRLQPGCAEAHYNRATVLHALKRPQEALADYERALALKPDYPEAWLNCGIALQALGRPGEALDSYAQALAAKPDYAAAFNRQGQTLQALGRMEEALDSYAQAVAAQPDYAEAFYNQGIALQAVRRLEEAVASYAQALAIKPDYAAARDSYSSALVDQGIALHTRVQLEEALACFTLAAQIKPDLADAHLNEGICRLLMGDLARGWEKYEWRWETKALAADKPSFPRPLWLGQAPLRGKTIFLHAEQGLGDVIQFCRYAKLVATQGATVVLGVPPALKALLANLEGVSGIIATGEPLREFDYHCPLLSLPLACKTELGNIPAAASYLRADAGLAKRWQARLGGKTLPRIGLVWAGNPKNPEDLKRSIPLAQFAKLATGPAQFISLHKELRPDDQVEVARRPEIAHYGEDLSDFTETAALIANLDLVVAVDAAVAHLAAALGKPVWLLLPSCPDWRWLLDRDDSPWYPTIRLFRQPRLGDWDSVINRVGGELARFCQAAV